MEDTERELNWGIQITELIPILEDGMTVGKPTAERLSVTGKPYVTLTSGGIKIEGEMIPGVYATGDRAIEAFKRGFREYAGWGTKIYWRRYPQMNALEWKDDYETGHWYYVDCRVLVEI